jgi:hypothetical protein
MKTLILFSLLAVAPVFAATCHDGDHVKANLAESLDVPFGVWCQVEPGTTIGGNLTVEGSLVLIGAHVTGNVIATGGVLNIQMNDPAHLAVIDGSVIALNSFVMLNGFRVNGSVQATNSIAFILYNGSVGNAVNASESTGRVDVQGVVVANNAIFSDNSVLNLVGNKIGKNLNCGGNGAVSGSGNTGQHLNGQCSSLQ